MALVGSVPDPLVSGSLVDNTRSRCRSGLDHSFGDHGVVGTTGIDDNDDGIEPGIDDAVGIGVGRAGTVCTGGAGRGTC